MSESTSPYWWRRILRVRRQDFSDDLPDDSPRDRRFSIDELLSRYEMQVWTRHSISRAATTVEQSERPIALDGRLLFAVILGEANVPAETDSANFVLQWLWRRSDTETSVDEMSVGRAAVRLMRLADDGIYFFPPAEYKTTLRDDEGVLFDILEKAESYRSCMSSQQPEIDTRHMIAVLLQTPEVRKVLRGMDVRESELRRDLYEFITKSHPEDSMADWRRVLLGAGFEVRNLVARDTWTRDDALGYRLYAQAITDSILEKTTVPPLTVGIQAPWGQGKTSLMRMIQERLDPEAPLRDEQTPDVLLDLGQTASTTYRDVLRWLREWAGGRRRRRNSEGGMLHVPDRRVPTIWFNPLYYTETKQVWAGMAHAILHQLAQQLSVVDREKFWLHLQLARINPAAVRRDVHQYILRRAVPCGLAFFAIMALLLTGDLGERILQALTGLGLGTLAGAIWARSNAIDTKMREYVTEPDYHTQLGLLHLVDHDLDLALSLLVGSKPIAVFIDDLDRCEPQTVNQIILAINQFLSLPRRNVFFFLGMDMEMVAAALEQAQKETLSSFGAQQRRSFGWRFMEKFVQLPFVIPHLDAPLARTFAAEHLRGEERATAITVGDAIDRVRHVRYAEQLGDIAKDALSADLSAEDRAEVQSALSRRATELMKDPDSDEIEKIVALAIDDLDLNPRTIKRYFALVRLLRNVQLSTAKVQEPDYDRRLVLRAAHLLMNWPQFVQWVRGTPSLLDRAREWKPTLQEVETIVTETNGYESWCTELKKLFGAEPPLYLHDILLYRFLRKITSDRPGLADMYAARMF
jgi:hypothetical protein